MSDQKPEPAPAQASPQTVAPATCDDPRCQMGPHHHIVERKEIGRDGVSYAGIIHQGTEAACPECATFPEPAPQPSAASVPGVIPASEDYTIRDIRSLIGMAIDPVIPGYEVERLERAKMCANRIVPNLERLAAEVSSSKQLREENARLKSRDDQHKRLCLAELGGESVWPCGCHEEITDSYGSRKPLTEADGDNHVPCDHHAAMAQENARLLALIVEDHDPRIQVEACCGRPALHAEALTILAARSDKGGAKA